MFDFSFGESTFSISEMRASDAVNKPGELFIDFMDTDNCNVNMYKMRKSEIKLCIQRFKMLLLFSH